MNALLQTYRSLPRAGQWLVWLGVFVIAYVAIWRPLNAESAALSERASMLQQALARQNEFAQDQSGDGQFLSESQKAFGQPQIPGSTATGAEGVHRIFDDILDEHTLTSRNINESHDTLQSSPTNEFSTSPVTRLSFQVSFEGEPIDVTNVIQKLEARPEIALISRVRLERVVISTGPSRVPLAGKSSRPPREVVHLRASLTAESWITTGGSGPSSAPTSPSNEEIPS